MSIKQLLNDEINKAKSEKEKVKIISEIITVLHEVNENCSIAIVEEGLLTKEKAALKNTTTDSYLKQSLESIKETIKLSSIAMRVKEIEKIEAEKEDLKKKIERAQQLIDEAKKDADKAKNATLIGIKNNMKISRDKIVALANTTSLFSGYINTLEQPIEILNTYNNIALNINMLVEELSNVGLWDENETKPVVDVVSISKIVEEPKKKATRKSTKKIEDEPLQEELDLSLTAQDNDDEIDN